MMERKRERYCYRVRPSVAALYLSVLLYASGAPAQTVAFINPGKSDEIYWVTATQSMQAAAKSLGMAFEVQYAQRGRRSKSLANWLPAPPESGPSILSSLTIMPLPTNS